MYIFNGATAINLTFLIFSILNLIFVRLDQFDHVDFKSENRFWNFFSLLELEHVLKLHILMHEIFFLGIMKIIIFFILLWKTV
jgi:hypothetical protein